MTQQTQQTQQALQALQLLPAVTPQVYLCSVVYSTLEEGTEKNLIQILSTR